MRLLANILIFGVKGTFCYLLWAGACLFCANFVLFLMHFCVEAKVLKKH